MKQSRSKSKLAKAKLVAFLAANPDVNINVYKSVAPKSARTPMRYKGFTICHRTGVDAWSQWTIYDQHGKPCNFGTLPACKAFVRMCIAESKRELENKLTLQKK